MEISELNKLLEVYIDSDRYLHPPTAEQRAVVDKALEDFYNSPENQKVIDGDISTFNKKAKKWLDKLKKVTIKDIKGYKEQGFDKEKTLKELKNVCTETLWWEIPTSTKTNFGVYGPNNDVIKEILTDKDYKWLEEQNTQLENDYPYEEYKQEFDIVYSGVMNKLINYFNKYLETWYDETIR